VVVFTLKAVWSDPLRTERGFEAACRSHWVGSGTRLQQQEATRFYYPYTATVEEARQVKLTLQLPGNF
jgi:hypothetical protein